jgi:tRNA (cytidine/uridine-2'-O-)-methyltransferase
MAIITFTPPSFEPDLSGQTLFHVVLVHPEIPQNTGNIARLCAGMRAWLHLVHPLGYSLEDRYLKRAGLDYWPGVTLSQHADLAACEALLPQDRTWILTRRGTSLYREVAWPQQGSVIVFGSESKGLPAEFVQRWAHRGVRIPTSGLVRSHNLANAVAITGYEILRQQAWEGETPMEG